MRLSPVLSLCALALAAPVVCAAPKGIRLRIATQAPDGTVWMDAMNDIKREVAKRSKGRVKFEFYPNGSQGDEKAVIERMEAQIMDGGLFTGIGLGEILPKIRILELPFTYRSTEELEAVKAALEDEFQRGFEEQGFVMLGWAEVGWAYIFSKNEARNLEELRKRKIWRWQGDPLAERTFQSFGLNGVPLALTGVLTSLETGMIDSVYNSPYGLVGLQWHRDLRYMSRMNVGHGTGALLVRKQQWDQIPAKMREGIAKLARERLDQLLVEVRQKNEETVQELQSNGMKIIPIPEEEMPRYLELGKKTADEMVGSLYSQETLDKVRGILEARRAESGK
ncbi:MAG: TRAP transporter substrate-binding protein DctP [Planctomycetota bacterium]